MPSLPQAVRHHNELRIRLVHLISYTRYGENPITNHSISKIITMIFLIISPQPSTAGSRRAFLLARARHEGCPWDTHKINSTWDTNTVSGTVEKHIIRSEMIRFMCHGIYMYNINW